MTRRVTRQATALNVDASASASTVRPTPTRRPVATTTRDATQKGIPYRAEPRDASPFTLRTPIDIAGTFLDPQIKPHKGPLAARGAAAIALAAINPLLAIIPFVDPGGDPEGGCQPQKKERG